MNAEFDLVIKHTGDSLEQAQRRICELEKFLAVAASSHSTASPSDWVDQAWHAILEYDDVYRKFLHERDLPYIRHIPGAVAVEVYLETRSRIAEKYGTLDEIAWPMPGARGQMDCGSCGSDGGHD